jgi:hypothetical protein
MGLKEGRAMRIEGSYTFLAPIAQVYAALLDAESLARAVPGCERLIQLGPAEASGAVTFEARLRAGNDLCTLVARLNGGRSPQWGTQAPSGGPQPPAQVRLDLRVYRAGRTLTGQGVVDLVDREGHTVGAYSVQVAGADGAPGAREREVEVCQAVGALCERLARDLSERAAETVPAPGPIENAGGILVALAPRLPATPLSARSRAWAERAGWMGAGLLVGIGVLALTTRLVQRLAEREEAENGE